MENVININGFEFDSSEQRAWTPDKAWGLAPNEDGTLSLLNEDGYPMTGRMSPEDAQDFFTRYQPSEWIGAIWERVASAC